MKLSLFDYELPKNLIAQKPTKPRDHSRLLVLDKKKKKIVAHDHYYNLDKYLDEGDVLVFNDSKVLPARLKFDGGVEVFLLKEMKNRSWEVIGKKLRFTIYDLRFKNINLRCEIVKRLKNGNWEAKFNVKGKKFREVVREVGETPLPPYIKMKDSKMIRKDYQTIYADPKHEGSVAAPTAGFHFTKNLMKKLEKKGIRFEFVTLHVGLGTFAPVKSDKIEEHKMHAEYAVLNPVVAKRLNGYKKEGKKIVAVGTTSARVLEGMVFRHGPTYALRASAWRGREVNIFIYPGYEFKFVDSLVTNFHLPKSTLLMLVSALVGREFILRVYKLAVKKKYRFFSFGDGMLIK